MLSLPLIAPQNEYMLFLSPHLRPTENNNTNNSNNNNNPSAQHQQNTRRPNTQNDRSSLAQLQADELAIATRKHNIRRFGAAWIKPPGVAKTLQAETEERAEREEQEAIQRREQMILDMQAQQEADDVRQRAQENAAVAGDEEGEEEGERDLDDDIPDADADADADADLDDTGVEAEEASYGSVTESDEEDDDEEAEEDEGTEEVEEQEQEQEHDVSFNDESLLEGSFLPVGDDERMRVEQERYARLEEAELTGVARDELELGIERDLDDSVPEAGSYQHTDSEMEDDTISDEDEEEDEVDEDEDENGDAMQGTRQEGPETSEMDIAPARNGHSGILSRDVSSLLESSFVSSSPVMGRLRSAAHRVNQR